MNILLQKGKIIKVNYYGIGVYMDKKTQLENKKQDLKNLQEKINKGYKPGFIKFFIRPLLTGGLGALLLSRFIADDIRKVGVFVFLYFLFLIIFTFYDKKKIENEKARDIEKRIKLQKEIVSLGKEIRNENS